MMTCPSCGGESPDGFKFCGHCGALLADGDHSDGTSAARASVTPRRDERRQVTVMFADVSGFTRMSDRLDAEDVHTTMNDVFAGLGRAIEAEGGYIDKYIGDNVMALFGAPVAHEDDPARGCRAALAMRHFLREFSRQRAARLGVELKMRIGLNDGSVVAGGVGSNVKMQYTVMGDAVNVASRLETAASPGGILVSASIQRRVREQFCFGPVQQLTLKGKPQPVSAYELFGERSEADGEQSAAAPLIGRDHELAALRQMLAAGTQWIELRGPGGAGCSRLAHDAAQAEGRQLLWITPAARGPFALVRRIVQTLLREDSGDAACATDNASFDAALGLLGDPVAPYAAALRHVAAPFEDDDAAVEADPQALRRMVEVGFKQLMQTIAARRSGLVLLIRQWEQVDAASAELLDAMRADEAPGVPVIVSSAESSTTRNNVIDVPPLTDEASRALLAELTGGADLPGPLEERILRVAGGLPLLMEELVASLFDSGVLSRTEEGATICETVTEIHLPDSLRAAMMARLDRLELMPRDLLQQCSVQGVEFDLRVAKHVRRDPPGREQAVEPLAEQLTERGLIMAIEAGAVNQRRFVQELMHQVCYEALLRRDRRHLHARVADALRDLGGVMAAVLAHHERHAERWAAAGAAQRQAADDAAGLYLNDEALARYDDAVELLGRCVADDATARRESALAHGGAGRVLLRLGRYDPARERARRMQAQADELGERAEALRLLADVESRAGASDHAAALLQQVVEQTEFSEDTTRVLSDAWHDLAKLHHHAGRFDQAIECIAQCRSVGGSATRLNTLRADLLEGMICHTRGRFDEAQIAYARALESAESIGSLTHAARAANALGNAARDQGDYTTARQWYQRALESWSRMADIECIAGANNNLGNVAMSLGDYDVAESHYRDVLTTAQHIGNPRSIALAEANLGLLAMERGDGMAAVEHARRSIASLNGTGDRVLAALVRVVEGEGLMQGGHVDQAAAVFSAVLEQFDPADHPLAVAGARRGMGCVHRHRGETAEAQRELTMAMQGFEQLKRLQETERTRMLLAELALETGDPTEAARLARMSLDRCANLCVQRDVNRAREILARTRTPAD